MVGLGIKADPPARRHHRVYVGIGAAIAAWAALVRVDTPPRPPTPVPAGHNLRIQFCVARC